MNEPLVSIGLPVFNGGERIAGALDSLLRQSFTDFEVVVVDNASTDNTSAICQDYARIDHRIRYFRNPTNIGVNPNHDRVFELSRGKYFAWFADDVEYSPDMLAGCLKAINQKPDDSPALVYPRCGIIYDSQPRPLSEQKSIACADPHPWRRLTAVVRNVGLVNQLYGLMNSAALRQTRLNGLYPSSDYVLLAELAMLGELREITEVLVRRRIDTNRGTAAVLKNRQAWNAWLGATTSRSSFVNALPHRERLALEYFRAAWNSPIKFRDKFQCLACILPVYYARTSRIVRVGGKLLRPWRWRHWWHRRHNLANGQDVWLAKRGGTANHE